MSVGRLGQALRLWAAIAAAGAPFAASADEPAAERYKLETSGWLQGCPSPAELRRAIVSKLGWDPFSPRAGATVSVAIESDGGRLGGTVELRGASGQPLGTRSIPKSNRKCAELSNALALVVTLTLDQRAHTDAAPTIAPEIPPSPPPTEAVLSTVALAQPERPRLRWSLALGGEGGAGVGPGAGLGAVIAVEARGWRWSGALEAGGDYFSGASVPSGRVWGLLESAAGTACWRPLLLGLSFGACGLAATGLEQAEPTGLIGAHSSSRLFLALGMRLLVEVPIGGDFSLIANLDPAMPILRARFTLGDETLWQAPSIWLAGGARLAYAF